MRSGFSLIELLVVVAIIGILAAVGVVGYQGYIDSTQDEATKANQSQISRAISTDTLAITEGLGGASDINKTVTKTSTCSAQITSILTEINVTQAAKSPVRSSCPRAFNGNLALNWPGVTKSTTTGLQDNCGYKDPVTAASATKISVPRGMVMVACADAAAVIGSNSYKIYTCVCSGQDYCDTTDVSDFCSSDADPAGCRKNFMNNNPTKCPTPNTPQS